MLKNDQLAALEQGQETPETAQTSPDASGAAPEVSAPTPSAEPVPQKVQPTPEPTPSASQETPQSEAPQAIAQPEPEPQAMSQQQQPPEASQAPEVVVPAPATEQPPVAPGSAPESAGAVAALMRNPATVALLGGVVVVLLVLTWLVIRRRKLATAGFEESILTEPKSTADSKSTVAEEAADESSFLSDFAVSDMGSIQSDAVEQDPLSEVDVYLAYGRYQQAEERVREAMRQDPVRNDLKVKLLEVYYASRNRTAFESLAMELFEALGDSSDPLWQKVVPMGLELCPEHPLFAENVDQGEMVRAVGDDFTVVARSSDAGSRPSPEPSFGFPQTDAQHEWPDEASMGFDLDSEVTIPDAKRSDAAGDFDFSAPETTEDEEGFDADVAGFEEVGTKLDLAKAYIDMGDPDGARGILDEVMEEGDEEQKSEAQELLRHIS